MTAPFAFLAANPDLIGTLQTAIQNAIQGKGTIFIASGITLAKAISAISVALWGIGCYYRGLDMEGLTNRIFVIGSIAAMLLWYNTPVPFLSSGMTFPQLIQSGPNFYAHQLGESTVDQVNTLLDQAVKQDPADIGNIFLNAISWVIVRFFIELTRFAMTFVLAYGYAAQAVCVIVGPIFIPFLAFEPLSFLFWGWFKCFLQYSFYPLVAASMVMILTNTLIAMWPALPVGLNLIVIPYLLFIIVGTLSVPSLVSHLFSGSSSMGGAGAVARIGSFAAGKML